MVTQIVQSYESLKVSKQLLHVASDIDRTALLDKSKWESAAVRSIKIGWIFEPDYHDIRKIEVFMKN